MHLLGDLLSASRRTANRRRIELDGDGEREREIDVSNYCTFAGAASVIQLHRLTLESRLFVFPSSTPSLSFCVFLVFFPPLFFSID